MVPVQHIRRLLVSAALVFVLILPVLSQATDPQEIPYRRGKLTIDGDLGDWTGPVLLVELEDPQFPPPAGNRATIQVTWDHDTLWFAFHVFDTDLLLPPDGISGLTLYQWDSVEIYLDSDGNASPRMDSRDFQFILSANGDYAVQQGDPMLYEIHDWQVPKRERQGIAIEAATVCSNEGFVVECAIPFQAVGLLDLTAGHTLGLDLAWGDWLEDHPRLPEFVYTLESLESLEHGDGKINVIDPEGLGWDCLEEWENRAYRPYSWRSERDFGYPSNWATVMLVGGPSFSKRMVDRWGAWNLVLILAATSAVLAILSVLLLRLRHRRRMRDLLDRLAALEQRPEYRLRDSRESAPDLLPAGAEPIPPTGIADQAVAYIQAHLGENITVAQLAEAVNVSPRTLQRAMGEALGNSPREVILALKMRQARALLETGEWRVGDVAFELGFESQYNFSRRFKGFFQVTPSSVIQGAKQRSTGVE